jgi:hypothetical protein
LGAPFLSLSLSYNFALLNTFVSLLIFIWYYFGCNLFNFRYRLWTVYNLNYTPTTLWVESWRDITSGGTRTKKVEYHCSRQLLHKWRWGYPQEDSWYLFLLEAESTPGHSAARRIRSIKKYRMTKLNRTYAF